MESQNKQIIYHGSNVAVEQPQIRVFGHYKDFGYGFYCTKLEQQAKKWAMTKSPRHVVSLYGYNENFDGLQKKSFSEMSDEWLDFVASCRRGIEHQYDIVEGPMADDQIWDYVEDFVAGNISREAFWALARFKHPTHQIVFCTPEALQSITYQENYEIGGNVTEHTANDAATYLRFRMDIDYWLEEVSWNGEVYEFFDGNDSLNEWKQEWKELIIDNMFELLIDVRTGKISNWPQGKTASFRTVKIVDNGEYTLLNAEKKRICGYTGYVPECLSIEEKGWGDYLEFEVGSNGIIHNWKFGQNEIEEFMENIR